MNNELYNSIKAELKKILSDINVDGITEEDKRLIKIKQNEVRNMLQTYMNKYAAMPIDTLTVLFAFYEELIGYNEKDYITSKRSFVESKYRNIFKFLESFLFDTFNSYVQITPKFRYVFSQTDNIVSLTDAVNKMGSDLTIDVLNRNNEFLSQRMNEVLYKNSNANRKNEEINNLNDQITKEEELKAQAQKDLDYHTSVSDVLKETRKETVFSDASSKLFVDQSTLEKKVGKEESLEIGKILISKKLISELQSDDNKICQAPSDMYGRIKQKIKEKKFLNSLEFDVKTIDNIKVLKVRKKDQFFDKVASGKKPIIQAFMVAAYKKYVLKKGIIEVDKELINKIKMALVEKNKRYTNPVNEGISTEQKLENMMRSVIDNDNYPARYSDDSNNNELGNFNY